MGKWRGDRWGAVTVALVSAASLVLQYVILVRAWLAFPALYATWVAARGAVVQEYPYPFIDVGALGWAKAGGNAGLMLVLFSMAGGLLVGIDRRLGARLAPAWRREPARGE